VQAFFLINDRVQAIENIQIAQNINAVESSLRTELDRMTSTAGDWGTWTDTYNFIQDLNPDYVEANLSNSSLVVLDVHDIVYLDTAGKIRASKGVDLVSQLDDPLPNYLANAIEANPSIWKTSGESNSGIINIPEGKYLFASQPILKNDATGPIKGTVVILRRLDISELKKLAGLSEITISTISAPAGLSEALIKNKTPGSIVTIGSSNLPDYLKSQIAVIDITGSNPLFLQIEAPRLFYQTMSTISYTILTIFLTLAALLIVILWFLIQRTAVQPINKLNQKCRRNQQIAGSKTTHRSILSQ